eukprot:CAMPEP_0198522122 /NCGR_PEP_ID=MMETSP1462-20131121/21350_1 /TAXON_ID=1333877 /ORGANISM="Brandtodinium nutriculum, Strain RCC3387" /LENGTH=90 /DNA_ID=CAMNT_0044251779 /DNA_START=1 /DNA_END=269 /DNA_ORIENTATION=+
MAPRSRSATALPVAALGAVALLCALRGQQQEAFVAPLPSSAAAGVTVHQGCQRVASTGSAALAGAAPAIVSARAARPGVAAHFKVKLETP